MQYGSLLGVGIQILAQGLHVGLKGLEPCGGDAAQGAGPLALEGLLDGLTGLSVQDFANFDQETVIGSFLLTSPQMIGGFTHLVP